MDETILESLRSVIAEESAAIRLARERATALRPPAPEIGALLRWAVHTTGARQVVEVGSAGGVSGLWLLASLPERGVLTSIEPDPHTHGLAADAFADASTRVRSILGDPATVLPRLSDGGYDLILLQARPAATPDDVDHLERLLRPGGLAIARGVLRGGEHGDAHARFLDAIAQASHAFTSTVLPVDDGLLLATRHESSDASSSTPS